MKPAHPTRQKILSLAAYTIMAILLAYMLVHRYPPSLAVDSQAPLDSKIRVLGGTTLSLESIKKPALINFWATWCGPCEQELPILARLSQKYPRVSFVGIAVDSPLADIQKARITFGLDYIIAETTAQATKSWHAELVPTTYLIDAHGKIIWARAGLVREEELLEALKKLGSK